MVPPSPGIGRARSLRQNLSGAELLLWIALKKRPHGLKFRRQERCGPYYLDFFSAPARLAIEVDGSQHEHPDQLRRDQRRDAFVASQGIETIRVSARDVFKSVGGVAEWVCLQVWERIEADRRSTER